MKSHKKSPEYGLESNGQSLLKSNQEIVEIVGSLKKLEFGKLEGKLNAIVQEIYKELQTAGLYERNLNASLNAMLENVFRLFYILKTDHGDRGKIFANQLSIFLGNKIVTDPKLMKIGDRRKIILEKLQLYDMPFGCDNNTLDKNIRPNYFFDYSDDRLFTLKDVDVQTYIRMVKELDNLQTKSTDPEVAMWCATKLRQMDRFEASLRRHWLSLKSVKINGNLDDLAQTKRRIYMREKTPINS